MPGEIPSDFSIIEYDDWHDDTTWLTFDDDEHPNTLVAFFPTGRKQVVKFVNQGFEVRDRGEDIGSRDQDQGEWISSHDSEDDAVKALTVLRGEHGLAKATSYGWVLSDDENEDPRFVIDSLEDRERPAWFDEVQVEAGYKHTDGWRGYTTFEPGDGWTALTGGWVTGYPDETVRHKADAADVYQALYGGGLVAPIPMLWCFGVTSNVFSTSVDVFVPNGSEDLVNAWLDGLDMTTAERFDRAFT